MQQMEPPAVQPDFQRIETLTRDYFAAFDATLELTCRGAERLTTALNSWELTTRRITIGFVPWANVYTLRVIPDATLDHDQYDTVTVASQADFDRAVAPMPVSLSGVYENYSAWMGDPVLRRADDELGPAIYQPQGAIGVVSNDSAVEAFLGSAVGQSKAVDRWASIQFDLQPGSAYDNMQNSFRRFESLIRRKAFLERRIHRFMSEHRALLLPDFSACLFEQRLVSGSDFRRADFILERDAGMPALLIELESPANRAFRRDGELTREANHAREQIAEWVRFIDEEPANRSGGLSFLAGQKQRLVVIGRGLDHLDRMEWSRYADTTIWTYDMLLREARRRAHQRLCEIVARVGRDPEVLPPFN